MQLSSPSKLDNRLPVLTLETETQKACEAYFEHCTTTHKSGGLPLYFHEALERVNACIRGSTDLQITLDKTIAAVYHIFKCERAWLLFPCEPDAPSFRVPIEHTHPDFPGACALNCDIPMTANVTEFCRSVLNSDVPVAFYADSNRRVLNALIERFDVLSIMVMSIRPKFGKPWMLGLHQCSYARKWTVEDKRLFQEIGYRITDALDVLLMFRGLKKREKNYRLLIENQTDLIIKLDLEGRFQFISPSYCKMFGKRENDLLGKKALPMIHKNDRAKALKVAKKLSCPPYTACAEQKTLTRQGLKWLSWLYSPVFDEYNKAAAIIAAGTDITRYKQEQQALRENQVRLKLAVQGASLGMWDWDIKTGHLTCNDLFAQMIGYQPDELIPHAGAWLDLIHPEDKDKIFKTLYRHFKNETCQYSAQLRLKTKSGAWCWVHCQGQVLEWDDDKKPVRMAGTQVDITNKKLNEERLLRAHRIESIGNLAGGIAHDFNNILSSIIGYAELSIDEVEKETALEDNLQEIYTAGKRAKDLVKQILTFARQSAEERQIIQVRAIAKEVLRLIRATTPANIELRQALESNSLIMANATQMHQLIMNLCTNAVQAMENTGGILSICLSDAELDDPLPLSLSGIAPGDYIRLTVSDTGPGIEPDIIESIFEPYFTTKGIGEGTGMGLAMVHGIVESYNGKITVNSKIGAGTVFSIYLPITEDFDGYQLSETKKVHSGTERILVVDDELPIAKMMRKMLEQLGYAVTTSNDCIKAYELFKSSPDDFDLVITDMTMPGMTGDLLAERFIEIRPDIPIILCTGYHKKISSKNASQIGVKALTYKPVQKTKLSEIIRKVIDEIKTVSDECSPVK
ncbi:MAG: PAS domain S-box protein [Desulfobacteraceae bacterium]|nr:PAS domain S-box protein [Desulfobacteraceae bacterium]